MEDNSAGHEELSELYGVPEAPVPCAEEERLVRPESVQSLNKTTAPLLMSALAATVDGLLALECVYSQLPMLWVIDSKGEMHFAVEEIVTMGSKRLLRPRLVRDVPGVNETRLGHPALIGGADGRIGGELCFDPGWGTQRRGWKLTNASGRYGLLEGRTSNHLVNAVKLLEKFSVTGVSPVFYPVGD